MKLAVAISAIVVVSLLSPSRASASKMKAIVTKIESDSKAEVQEALADALGDEFSVIGFKEANRAATKLGFEESPSDKDFAKLADELGAEVVIAGTLESAEDAKPKSAKTLKIKVYVKGKKSGKLTVPSFKSAKSEGFKRSLHTALISKIGTINKTGEDEEEPKESKAKKKKKAKDEEAVAEEDDKPKKSKKKKKGDDEAVAEEDDKPKKSMASEDDEDPEGKSKKKKKRTARMDEEEGTEDDEMAVRKAPPHAASRVAIRVDFGISAASRTLDFNVRPFAAGEGNPPADYKNNVVPGARVGGEAYPFAFADPKGRAAGLGIWGDYDKTISLTLRSANADGSGALTAKAIQQRWSIGGGYRFSFTQSELSPTFTIGINYARRTFAADKASLGGMMLDLPDCDYKMYQPLATLRIPLFAQAALIAGGRGMLITDAGPITKSAQYGQAKVFGVEASGGFDIIFSNRVALRILGEFSQIGYTFTKGAGDKAKNRDGDPLTKDVFGAADRSMGGTATLGVLY